MQTGNCSAFVHLSANEVLALRQAHALLGSFVSSIDEIESGWWTVRSEWFPDDTDWNFDVIAKPHPAARVTPGRWVDLDSLPHRRIRLVDRERWMGLWTEEWTTNHRAPAVTNVESLPVASGEFCDAFVEGFELTVEEEGRYRERFRDCATPDNVRVSHLVLRHRLDVASIGSIHVCEDFGFLSNVTTRLDHQGHGHARALITAAVHAAHRQGAKQLWLQCEIGTAAERLYNSLGFDRQFTAARTR